MIAENINSKWILGGEEMNPYSYQYKCFHDGKWYLFETETELNAFLIAINFVFSLEAWKAEANQLYNELFASYYAPLKYEGESDIALTALNSAQYANEALSLAKWRNDTFDIIESVTEQQAKQITPIDFINSLPIYVSEEI